MISLPARDDSPQVPYSGYIDAHVHLRDVSAVEDIVKAGVVAVRDAGSSGGTALALRLTGASGDIPRVRSAGRALAKTGGYGALLGVEVSTREEIEREIEALRRDGAAIIKVIASGVVSLKQPGTITAGGFDRDELRSIVDAARGHGLSVMAHANGADAIRNAVDAGVASIEHGFFMTEFELRLLAEKGLWWVPTVGALHRAAERPDATRDTHAFIEQTINEHCTMVRKAHELGIHLAVGTDAVLPDRRYGNYYETELAYFRRAGIPPQEVQRIARGGDAPVPGL